MRRKFLLLVMFCLTLIVLLPYLALRLGSIPQGGISVKSVGPGVRVLMHDTGKVELMPLEEYLVGVVAAEMPAEFDIEALKAQAVAARTYTMRRLSSPPANSRHPGADVCTDSTHNQGWLSDLEMRRRWGMLDYWRYHKKIVQAVKETEAVVIAYAGKLIEPVYHSTSGGRTEDASEVWQYSFPYLQSVECKWDKASPRYNNTKTFSTASLSAQLAADLETVPALSGQGNALIKVLERTVSGRVKRIRIGDKVFEGVRLRQMLGLTSTFIDWEIKGDKITFKTTGYGHGVGLCQYGANGMAKEGKTYTEILSYYYRGVKVEPYN